jgi:hypothetical protein
MVRAPTSIAPIRYSADSEAGRAHIALEDGLSAATSQAWKKNLAASWDGRMSAPEWQKTTIDLLRRQVLLLAMKSGQAPLPVSNALWRGLLRQGLLNDLYDLGSIARRLLFLGDGRTLLAELTMGRPRSAAKAEKSSNEIEAAKEDRPQLNDNGMGNGHGIEQL